MPVLRCQRCGASWPSEHEVAPCPVCSAELGSGDPNAGGSPSPGEDDVLLDLEPDR